MERSEMTERYRMIYPVLWRQAMRRLNNACDAEDALQNAFISAWIHLPSLRRTESFSGWMMRIVQHETINLIRKRRMWLPLDEAAYVPTMESEQQWMMRMDFLQDVQRLSGAAGRCFRMRYVEGRAEMDIAKKMHISPVTVRVHLHHARNQIRHMEKRASA